MPRRIDHVAIIVNNIENALEFYRDVLGIVPTSIKEVASEQVRIAFLPLGGPEGSKVELVEPLDADSSLAKFLQKRGEGLHHICFEVEDVDTTLHELREKGASILDEQPRPSADGRAIFLHPRGTHGVLIELVERE